MKNSVLLLKLIHQFSRKRSAGLQVSAGRSHEQNDAGFTLIEVIVVIVIIAVLSAIAAPGWLSFVNQQRITAVNDAIFGELQKAQSEAKRTKLSHSVSFKQESGQPPKVAVYRHDPDSPTWMPDATSPAWRALGEGQDIKRNQVLLCSNISDSSVGVNKKAATDSSCTWTGTPPVKTITFDYQGILPIGSDTGLSITAAVPKSDNLTQPLDSTKRCVVVETIIGGMRTGRYAYDATNNPAGCR